MQVPCSAPRTHSRRMPLWHLRARVCRAGTTAAAAHAIVFQVWLASRLLVDALAIAAQTLIAQELEDKPELALKTIHRVLQLALILGLALGIALTLGRDVVPRLFTTQPQLPLLPACCRLQRCRSRSTRSRLPGMASCLALAASGAPSMPLPSLPNTSATPLSTECDVRSLTQPCASLQPLEHLQVRSARDASMWHQLSCVLRLRGSQHRPPQFSPAAGRRW
jgi:MatE